MKMNAWASTAAYGAAASGFLYGVFFLFYHAPILSSLFLMLSGLFALGVMVALYNRLRDVEPSYILFVLILGVIAAAGTFIHAGYDLANYINPPGTLNPDLPSQIDPRGLLAFGLMGVAQLKWSWLISKTKSWPKNLAYLGYLSGALLIVIYLGRLIILNPAVPFLKISILAEGFVIGPLWYVWLGKVFSKKA